MELLGGRGLPIVCTDSFFLLFGNYSVLIDGPHACVCVHTHVCACTCVFSSLLYFPQIQVSNGYMLGLPWLASYSQKKKVSLSLVQFPLDPSCHLFICLFIFGTRSWTQDLVLLTCTTLLSHAPAPQPFSQYLNHETGRRQIGLLLAEFLQQVYYWQPLIVVKGKKKLSSYRTKSTNWNTAVLEIHSVHLSIRERLSLPVPRGWAIILQAHRSSLIGDSWHLHLFTTKCVGWLQRASQGPWSLFQS